MKVSSITQPTGRKGYLIGQKFTGKHQFHADSSGAYWEALPLIEGNALELQSALLAKPQPPKPAGVRGIITSIFG